MPPRQSTGRQNTGDFYAYSLVRYDTVCTVLYELATSLVGITRYRAACDSNALISSVIPLTNSLGIGKVR